MNKNYQDLIFTGKLEKAAEQIDQINVEEESFGWEMSQYPLRKKIVQQTTPYMKLFKEAAEFSNKNKFVNIEK